MEISSEKFTVMKIEIIFSTFPDKKDRFFIPKLNEEADVRHTHICLLVLPIEGRFDI